MRVLCLGLDGADYDLVRELLPQGRLPTLARLSRQGTFGPLRSTTPAFTPTAWSSLLTGLNPAGHGIFAFTSNPNRGGGRLESAASRAGAPLWRYLGAAGIKSAFVTVPFTHPPEPLKGILVTGFGGPRRPEIVPLSARNAILGAYPDLRASRHPADLSDFKVATATLTDHVEEIADVCLLVLELHLTPTSLDNGQRSRASSYARRCRLLGGSPRGKEEPPVKVGAAVRDTRPGRNGDGEGTGLHARLVSMSLALVTGWLLVWGAVAVAGTFSCLRPS